MLECELLNRVLAEGLKFYGDLVRQKLDPLKQRVSDFVVARDLEKRMMLEQVRPCSGFPRLPVCLHS